MNPCRQLETRRAYVIPVRINSAVAMPPEGAKDFSSVEVQVQGG